MLVLLLNEAHEPQSVFINGLLSFLYFAPPRLLFSSGFLPVTQKSFSVILKDDSIANKHLEERGGSLEEL